MSGILADAGGAGAVLARAASFVATIGVIGGAAFRWNAARGRDPVGAAAAAAAASTAVWTVTWGALLLLVAVPVRIWFQAQALTMDGDAVLPMTARVMQTTWGRAAGAQATAALVLLFAAAAARRGHARAWRTITLGALLLATAPAYMGHANATEAGHNWAMMADWTHVLAAGAWAGGVAALALSALALRAVPGGADVSATLIEGFKRLAQWSVGILLASAVISAKFRLTAWDDFVGTAYGRLLLLKIGLVFIALALGRLHSQTAAARMRAGAGIGVIRSIAWEAVTMVAVICATALLAGSPPPGTE